MLDTTTKKRIDDCRDILVGKLPDPKAQIEQITIALIYKFMDDMDKETIELGGKAKFFSGKYAKYAWDKLFDSKLQSHDMLKLYADAIESMELNPNIPQLFRDIFKNAYLPYRDPETLKMFLKTISGFEYSHSEKLGDAFEYLLSVMGSQGDAGQFRTPRHIIDFMVEIVKPQKHETVLDPACGTSGFLIASYKHVIKNNSSNYKPEQETKTFETKNKSVEELTLNGTRYKGDKLTPDDRKKLGNNIKGYDISPDMVRMSLVNMYLHGIQDPHIDEYDTLTSEERWNEQADIILANPPFMSPKGGIRPHKRFSVQSNRSEVLFVNYIAEHLSVKGRAAVIVPEGIIFQSGKAYKELRKMLVENYLWGVISLPAGVFNPYSGVKTSILLMDKELVKKTDKLLFVKVENDGFALGAQRKPIGGSQLPETIQLLEQYTQLASHSERGIHSERSIHSELASHYEQGSHPEPGSHSELVSESLILTQLLEKHQSLAHAVDKEKIAESGEYNLSGERYRVSDFFEKSNFPIVELSEIAEVISGQSPKGEFYNTEKKGLPFYQGKTEFTDRYIGPPVKWTTQITKEADKGDILMSVRAPVGPVNFATDHCCIGRGLAAIRANSKVDKIFLFHILKSLEKDIVGGGGSVFDSISRKQIEQIKIPLPPLEVQKEIVAEIESYQKIIDGARMVVENYKPQIKIDPEWEMVKLENSIDFVSGLTLSISKNIDPNGVPIISMNSIKESGELVKEGIRKIKLPEKKTIHFLKKGDLLFNWRNGSQHLVGKTAIFDWEEDTYVFASFLLGIRPHDDKYRPKFLWYLLNQYRLDGLYKQFMRQNINGLFNREELKILKMPLVPLETQDDIIKSLDRQGELVNANKQLIEIFEQKIKDKINEVWGE